MPFHRVSWPALLLAVVLAPAVLTGCAGHAASQRPVTAGYEDAARPAQAGDWIRSELYFGVGRDDGTGDGNIDERRWRAFLDSEVTTRFPDGLTVFDAYGQWLFRGDPGKPDPAPNRLRTKVLVILHEGTQARRDDIEAIRLAWKQQTGHQSVLWVSQPATVAF